MKFPRRPGFRSRDQVTRRSGLPALYENAQEGQFKSFFAGISPFPLMDEEAALNPRPGIGEYLIQRIYEKGVRHVFGVPGDYILNFYAMLDKGPLQMVNTCDEQGAGFAADAYARLHGLGVVCVTYNVGGFKVVNTTAEAYAEKSPVLVIAGAPGWQERKRSPLLHHTARDFSDQYEIFRRITVASTNLSDPADAYREIDRVLEVMVAQKGPGYIEIPRDIVTIVPEKGPDTPSIHLEDKIGVPIPPGVLNEIVSRVNNSFRPVIWAGEEIARFHLGLQVQQFAEKARIPIVSTMLGKSAVDETSPLFLGVYAGVIGDEKVREYVEGSDCLLVLGSQLNDVNLGAFTAAVDQDRMIVLSGDSCRIGTRFIKEAGLNLLPDIAGQHLIPHDEHGFPPSQVQRKTFFSPNADTAVTAARMFQAIDSFLDESHIVITDIGDAVMGSMVLTILRPDQFLCSIYYSAMGFAVPAAIGAQAARPDLRPVVIVGDGAFQMTGIEVSTAARYGMNPIVIVMNNSGFGTERPMIDGRFNDIASWQYHRIPQVIGKGRGWRVTTETELYNALAEAGGSGDLSIIEVMLDPYDITPQLRRMCERLAKGVKK